MLQYEAKLRKNHRTTTKSELTYLWCTLATEVSGRGRMGGGRVGGTCPKLRETGRTRRVDQAVGDQVPPVLLPLSRPHDGFSG